MLPFRGASIATCRVAFVLIALLLSGCRSRQNIPPSIEFTEVPEPGPGRTGRMEKIAGRAVGARPGQRIVLFARSGRWWVQPFADRKFTAIQPDSTWTNSTHLGTEYAALLVQPGYSPPNITDALPAKGGAVVAVATVGRKSSPGPKRFHFSGYEWEVEAASRDRGGVMYGNRSSNTWTDARGWLHLRIAREAGGWTSAAMNLVRSLGYGSYSVAVHELPQLEPGAVLAMYTWDDREAEMDIELSQWGDPANKNSQFAIQPYYVPANVFRFDSPHTALIYSFQWAAGRVSFQAVQLAPGRPLRTLADHVFTSGIPTPGREKFHIDLYVYGLSRTPQQNGVEVVIEKFEYLP
jgi:hypothetical protein